MTEQLNKQRLFYSFFIPSLGVFIMGFVFVLTQFFNSNLETWGVWPRHWQGFVGIVTHIFVHSSWQHLLNNLLSFWILSVTLFYFYHNIALKVILYQWVLVGLCIWLGARDGHHVGASGLIYALAFFLFVSGFIRRHIPLIAISFIVAFLYGSMVWHIFPWQPNETVSWEGHLFGAIIGVILAFIYRYQGPQKPVKVWAEELPDEEDPFWDIPLEDDEKLS